MRGRVVLSAVAVVLGTSLPGLATEPVLASCAVGSGSERLTVEGRSSTSFAPLVPLGSRGTAYFSEEVSSYTSRTYVVDLAGQPAGTAATLDGRATWRVPTNDFRLYLRDAAGTSGVSKESAAGSRRTSLDVQHCARVTVTVSNFLAGPDEITLGLALTVRPGRP